MSDVNDIGDLDHRLTDALTDLADSAPTPPNDLWDRTQRRITSRRNRRAGLAALVLVVAVAGTIGGVVATREDAPRRVETGPVGTPTTTPSAPMPERAAVVTTDGRLLIVDADTGDVLVETAPEEADTRYVSVAAAPDGESLVLEVETARGGSTLVRRFFASGEETVLARGSWPALSPDGRLLAFVPPEGGRPDPDPDLHVADLVDGEERTWPVDPDGPGASIVSPPSWSPDGRRLAFRAFLQDGTPLRVLDLEQDATVTDARTVWFPDGADVVGYLGATGDLLGVWDCCTAEGGSLAGAGQPVRVVALDAATDTIEEVERDLFSLRDLSSVTADRSGRHLLAANRQGRLYRWSEGDDEPTLLTDGDDPATESTEGIAAVAWLPSEQTPPAADDEMPSRILASTSNNGVLVLDAASGQLLPSPTALMTAAFGAESIAVDPDGTRWFYTRWPAGEGRSCEGPQIEARRFDSGALTEIGRGERLLLSPDGRYLAAVSAVGLSDCGSMHLQVFDLAGGGSATFTPPDDEGPWFVRPLTFNTESGVLLVEGTPETGGAARAWEVDVADGRAREVERGFGFPNGVHGVQPVPDGTFVAAQGWAGERGRVVRLATDRRRVLAELYTTPSVPGPLAVDPSGRHVLEVRSEHGGATLLRWSEGDGTPARLLPNVLAAAWIPDSAIVGDLPSPTTTTTTTTPATVSAEAPTTMVAVTTEGTVAEVSVADGSEVHTIVAADADLRADSVEVDRVRGRVFFEGTGGCDGEGDEGIWQVPLGGGEPEGVTSGNEPSVSPDGAWLAFPRREDGCAAGALVLHEIGSGGERIWRDTSGEILAAEWAPDGHRVAVGLYTGRGGGAIRVVDTNDRYASIGGAPTFALGRLVDSVFAGGRWILLVIRPCDTHEDPECTSEVVTIDGDTGEQIESFGSFPDVEGADLDASGRHLLVIYSETLDNGYSQTVAAAVEEGQLRRIGPATDADW